MMSSIKTAFIVVTVFLLTACKTMPTASDEKYVSDSEQTNSSNTNSTAEKTSLQAISSDDSENNKSEQSADVQKNAINDDASAILTNEEQAQQFNQQLDERFADFDRLLLREREFLDEKQKEQGEPQNSGGRGASGEGSSEGLDDFDAIATGDYSSEDNSNSTQHTAGQNTYPSKNTNISTPPDLVNSNGDDVIARQLREAAQKEKEPILREKLWDEYRKYKSGT
jgi:hypothetical protein